MTSLLSGVLIRTEEERLSEARGELATATETHDAALDAYLRASVDGSSTEEIASLQANVARAARVRHDWREFVERLELEVQS